jgi:hypothetical protein
MRSCAVARTSLDRVISLRRLGELPENLGSSVADLRNTVVSSRSRRLLEQSLTSFGLFGRYEASGNKARGFPADGSQVDKYRFRPNFLVAHKSAPNGWVARFGDWRTIRLLGLCHHLSVSRENGCTERHPPPSIRLAVLGIVPARPLRGNAADAKGTQIFNDQRQ